MDAKGRGLMMAWNGCGKKELQGLLQPLNTDPVSMAWPLLYFSVPFY